MTMRRYWSWAIILGTVFHLFGFGADFNSLVGGFLAIMLVIGGMEMILNQKSVGQAVGPAVAGAFIVSFVPPFIAGIILRLWAAHPALLILLGGLALAAWTNFFRALRPRGVAQAVRSGGGRAVPVPRRWRQ